MLERKEALSMILKSCSECFSANGFEVKKPEGMEKGSAPIFEENESAYIEIAKNNLTVRIVSHGDLLDISEKDGDGDFTRKESNLFDLETAEDRDVKSICNEVMDVIETSYGKKAKKQAKKAPATVSKSAVRGGMSYDANTLASKIVGMYPELKEEYKANYERYGEFLAEDFFVNHGNEKIMETIRSGDRQRMKKLFRILGECYENGSTAVQDVIIVTILGELNNDSELIERCCAEITDEDFKDTLIAVNKFLASSAGKRMRKKLENPPKYKPKKKKGGMMSSMLNAQTPQQ